jgi:hypothetical protein
MDASRGKKMMYQLTGPKAYDKASKSANELI